MNSSPYGLLDVFPIELPSSYSSISYSSLGGDFVGIIDGLYLASTGKCYCLHVNASKVVISSIDPTTYTIASVVNDGARTAGINPSFCCDGTYFYVSTAIGMGVAANLLKYRLSDGAFIASLALTWGGQALCMGHNCRMDGDVRCNPTLTPNNTICYVSSANTDITNTPAFVKIDLNAWSILDGGFVASTANATLTDDSGQDATYLYYGFETNGKLIRVKKSSLASQIIVDPGIGSACGLVYHDGRYVMMAFYATSPGKLVRVIPGTLSARVISLPTGLDNPNELVTDGVSYFGTCYTNPGVVWAITP
jgi:hypothetical protein